MTSTLAEKFLNLTHLLRTYIEQEHLKGSCISSDPVTFAYFLELATKASSQPVKAVTPPPVSPKLDLSSVSPKPLISKAAPPPSVSPQTLHSETPKASSPSLKEPVQTKPLSKTFIRNSLASGEKTNFHELRTFFEKQLPSVALSDTIADDSIAKILASRWNTPPADIILLSFSALTKEQAFISNLARALNQIKTTQVLSARKIESEKGWEKVLKEKNLKLIIADNYNLQTLPELMKYFHEEATGKHRLGTVPLYLLSDLALYMQQPALKASLWKALCQSCQ